MGTPLNKLVPNVATKESSDETKESSDEIFSKAPHVISAREGEESSPSKPCFTMVCEGGEMTKKGAMAMSASDDNISRKFAAAANPESAEIYHQL